MPGLRLTERRLVRVVLACRAFGKISIFELAHGLPEAIGIELVPLAVPRHLDYVDVPPRVVRKILLRSSVQKFHVSSRQLCVVDLLRKRTRCFGSGAVDQSLVVLAVARGLRVAAVDALVEPNRPEPVAGFPVDPVAVEALFAKTVLVETVLVETAYVEAAYVETILAKFRPGFPVDASLIEAVLAVPVRVPPVRVPPVRVEAILAKFRPGFPVNAVLVEAALIAPVCVPPEPVPPGRVEFGSR